MIFIRPLIVGDGGKLAKFSHAQYDSIRRSQQETFDDRSLVKPRDWAVLPEEQSFQRNLPIPLPQNIRMLMDQDRARSTTASGQAAVPAP
jgi:general secretion pathway protein D